MKAMTNREATVSLLASLEAIGWHVSRDDPDRPEAHYGKKSLYFSKQGLRVGPSWALMRPPKFYGRRLELLLRDAERLK